MIAAYCLARVARVAGSGCWWPSAGMGSGKELLLHVSMMTPLLQLQTSTITREQQNPRPATSQHLNIWPQFQCNYDNSLLWSWETQNSCPFPLLLQHTIARCDNYLSITNERTDTLHSWLLHSAGESLCLVTRGVRGRCEICQWNWLKDCNCQICSIWVACWIL